MAVFQILVNTAACVNQPMGQLLVPVWVTGRRPSVKVFILSHYALVYAD